jgi:hypothetical protein
MGDGTMKIAGWLRTDPDRARQGTKKLVETVVIGAAIGELEAMSAAGRVLNQRDVPYFQSLDNACGTWMGLANKLRR